MTNFGIGTLARPRACIPPPRHGLVRRPQTRHLGSWLKQQHATASPFSRKKPASRPAKTPARASAATAKRKRPATAVAARKARAAPSRARRNGSTPSATARPKAKPACATCSAARARTSPRWPIWDCRCRPASPSRPRSAPIITATARPIRLSSRRRSRPRSRTSASSPARLRRSTTTRCSSRCARARAPRCRA